MEFDNVVDVEFSDDYGGEDAEFDEISLDEHEVISYLNPNGG